MVWYEEDCNFHRKQKLWWKNWSPLCLFLDVRNCAIWQLESSSWDYNTKSQVVDTMKVFQYQLECNERGSLVCDDARQNFHSYCETHNSFWKSVVLHVCINARPKIVSYFWSWLYYWLVLSWCLIVNDTAMFCWVLTKTTLYTALSLVFSTNVVCVKIRQKHGSIKYHDKTKQLV